MHRKVCGFTIRQDRAWALHKLTGRVRAAVWSALAVVVASLALVSGGCATSNSTSSDAATAQPAADTHSTASTEAQTHPSSSESVASIAERLNNALLRSGTPSTSTSATQPQTSAPVQWRRPTRPSSGTSQTSPADTSPHASSTDKTQKQGEGNAPNASTENASAESKTPKSTKPLTREELLQQLLQRVRNSDEPMMQRALSAATLSAAMGESALDETVLQRLDPSQRQTVQRYYQMVRTTMQQMAASETGMDRESLHQRIDTLFPPEPVNIQNLALCREVSGYGVYKTFKDHTFLAGRDQPVIVYAEVAHFRREPTDDDRYEVKLKQQIVLYNEADGLAVWRRDPEQIVDVSRNKRHDFFIVTPITLPRRLNVGKYRLKVRITDEHGGTIDETTMRIQLVADEKLVNEK